MTKQHCYMVVLAFLLASAPAATARAQSGGAVGGVVTDSSSGASIPGVNVVIEGTQQGASTDAQGNYVVAGLEPGTYTLRASFVGYADKLIEGVEVATGDTTTVNVALSQGEVMLEEVVAIGYGTQQSEDVTGSVTTVPTENIEALPVTGVDQALTGQVAGVQVNQVSGIPGGGPEIQIRGIGAIGAGSQPLYVIDGFPISTTSSVVTNPLNDLPPSDIESITVLKDASATAIYGSRGANGVVLVSTKSGRAGEMRIQAEAYMGVQQIPQSGRPDLLNAEEFARFRREAISDRIRFEEGREPTPDDIPDIYENPSALGEGTNWFNEITRTAPMQNVHLSIAGGSENIRSYVSGGYTRQQGVVLGSGYERFALRVNADTRLSEAVEVGVQSGAHLLYAQPGVCWGKRQGGRTGQRARSQPHP